MADKKSNKDFEHISDIIKNTLGKWLHTAGEPINRIWELWDSAAGDQIARNAHPAYLKNQILIVHVPSSAWIQQLQFSKKNIIEKLNTAAGSPLVSDIKFKIET
jgi:predicted nucleic acid-binding Zn ribbon protein